MLARLLSSLPALSDSPHCHLRNNHSNNTGSLQYVKSVLTLSPGRPMEVTVQSSHSIKLTESSHRDDRIHISPTETAVEMVFPMCHLGFKTKVLGTLRHLPLLHSLGKVIHCLSDLQYQLHLLKLKFLHTKFHKCKCCRLDWCTKILYMLYRLFVTRIFQLPVTRKFWICALTLMLHC